MGAFLIYRKRAKIWQIAPILMGIPGGLGDEVDLVPHNSPNHHTSPFLPVVFPVPLPCFWGRCGVVPLTRVFSFFFLVMDCAILFSHIVIVVGMLRDWVLEESFIVYCEVS